MPESPAPDKPKPSLKQEIYDAFRLLLTMFLGISHPNDYKKPPGHGK